jgi:hypothetical protein
VRRPAASAAGAIAPAAATAFFTVAASSVEPTRMFAASSAQRRFGDIREADRQAGTLPAMVSTTAAAAVACRRSALEL